MNMIKMNNHWALENNDLAVSHTSGRGEYGVSKWDAVNADGFLISIIINTLTVFIDEWADDVTPGCYVVSLGDDAHDAWLKDLADLRDDFVKVNEYLDEIGPEIDVSRVFSRLGVMLPYLWH